MANNPKGAIRVTNEKLRELLGLPPEVTISNVCHDPDRDIISIYVTSENETSYTKTVEEGARLESFLLEQGGSL